MLPRSIAFIGCFSAYHTEADIADYLELAGYQVDRYQHDRLDKDKFIRRPYDMVITSLPQLFPVEFWRSVRGTKVAWYFDWIAKYSGREAQYLPRLREFDLILSTDGFENPIYKGLNRHYLPHACDPRVYYPVNDKPCTDVGFIGHCYSGYRRHLLAGLDAKYDFRQVGNHEECWGFGYADACSKFKIVVGDNYRNDYEGYWSDRLYMSLSCRSFLLYPRVPGIEKYFKDKTHLALYDNESDLHRLIDYYLPRPGERERIARAGMEEAHLNHSWRTRVGEFWDICASAL